MVSPKTIKWKLKFFDWKWNFCPHVSKSFSKYQNENPTSKFVATIFSKYFSVSSLGNYSLEFLKLFHFDSSTKYKGIIRSNQLIKLNLPEKFGDVKKLNLLHSKWSLCFLQTKGPYKLKSRNLPSVVNIQ